MIHRWESCPGTAILKKFLDQELNKHEDDEEPGNIDNHYSHLRRTQETLIDVINDLTRHSYISNCQAQYLKSQKRLLVKMKPLL